MKQISHKTLSKICDCGNAKSERSKICINCLKLQYKNISKRICICGNKKHPVSKNCLKCFHKLVNVGTTIGHYFIRYKGNSNAYVHVRTNARSVMKNSSIVKEM